MVSQATVEAPVETPVDPAIIATETETPATPVVEGAAPADDSAATDTPQVQITEPEKPDYMTRADWEAEKATVAAQAASEALELDRRRRQTENARQANQAKRDTEDRQELIDTAKAAFGAAGIYEVPEDALTTAIDRMVRKRSDQLSTSTLDTVEQAWDYLTAPAYGKSVELEDGFESAAKRLGPKLQHLVDAIRPSIEKAAREGYVLESELPKRYEAMDAARAAKSREGTEELKRAEGTPTGGAEHGSLAWWNALDRNGRADPANQNAFDAWVAKNK